MKTLSANLRNAIKRNWKPFYIVKVTGNLKVSPYTERNFYFSTHPGSITDSGTFQIYPYLQSIPNPSENLDIFNAKSSIGGFSLNFIGYFIQDQINSYNFYNRDVKIYLGDISLSDLNDFELVYSGLWGGHKINKEITTVEITNSTKKVQKEIPTTSLTSTIFSNSENGIPADNIGKPNPVIYGVHGPFYYGYDGQTTTFNMTHNQKNNMVKCYDVGSSIYGGRTFQISDHELNEYDTQFYRVWMKDKATGRLVKIDSADFTIYSFSYGSFLTIVPSPDCYDYWYPDQNTTLNSVPSGVADWQDPDNAVDGDYSTYSQSFLSDASSIGDFAKLQVDFADYDLSDDQISEIKTYYVAPAVYDNTYFSVYVDNAFGSSSSTISGSSVFIKSVNSITDSDSTSDKVGTSLEFYNECISAPVGADDSTIRLYYCFKEVKYKPDEIGEIYIACKGKEANSTLATEFTGLSSDDLIENPAHIMGDILLNDLGLSSIGSGFDTSAAGELSGWKFSFTLKDFINTYDLLNNIAKECKSILYWDANNNPNLFTIKDSYTTDRTIDWNELASYPVTYKSKLDNIINKLDLKYGKFDSNYLYTISRQDDRTNTGSQDIYNYVSNTSIELDYVTDTTTAGYVADYYCKNDDDSFWSVVHNVVEVEVDLRGSNLYDSGTFKPLLSLEFGDVVEFQNMKTTLSGESYSGVQFIITKLQRKQKTIKITGFEVFKNIEDGDVLLLQSGDNMLLESGDKILLE